jgi:hypothetical protein
MEDVLSFWLKTGVKNRPLTVSFRFHKRKAREGSQALFYSQLEAILLAAVGYAL